jgi:hypothetical protein
MESFNKKIQNQFLKMCKTGKLFRSVITGQQVWDLYLEGFAPKDDPIFRDPNSTVHNCNICKNFIRRYGNIVAIDENYKVMTMFDVEDCGEYQNSANSMAEKLKNSKIWEVFFETFDSLNSLPYEKTNKNLLEFRLGIDRNSKRYTREEAEKYGVVKPNQIITFNHMFLNLPKEFVNYSGKSIESIQADFRSANDVFYRGMEEISLDTLLLVKDLINQDSLLDGRTHLFKIEKMITLKTEYDKLNSSDRLKWCWINSYNLPIAKFRNELIGTLCVELSEGKEINEACQTWNKRVDPVNYMKTSAPITKNMLENAKKDFSALGYSESDLDRRFAVISDINIDEVKHSNISNMTIKSASLFDSVKATSTRHKRSEFVGVEEVGIEKFMQDILPTCTSVEVFLSNKHMNNMVSLTTAKFPGKNMFKWSNPYSWTFANNLAGKSQIKEAVKVAGGKIDGVLRFSLIWNYKDGSDNSDLDAWCLQPNGEKIGYNTGFRKDCYNNFSSCLGQLDLDNLNPSGKLAVENIYFVNQSKLKNGVYSFWVNQYSARNSQGFKAEIEFDGQIYSYEYDRAVSGNVNVAHVTFDNGEFSIVHALKESLSSQKVYNLDTESFHKVNLICLSPNHWGDNNIGNKHYFFMLQDCKCPNKIKSFHMENLVPELAAHRKVLEVLSNSSMITSDADQLSGLGFNATVRDEIIVKLQGSFKRMLKIKF